MTMSKIDLKVAKVIYDGLTFLLFDYWQLISPFVISVIVINSVMMFKASEIDGNVIDLWKISSMIYIVIAFIVLFGAPMISVLSYISTSRVTNTDEANNSVYTLWIYLLWSAIVYKIMLMPLYYICNVALDKSKTVSAKKTIESIR